ncbi:neutrophil defensin 3-like isoform X1 [Erinaceus europaeus]|uniref:Neutrophil defensin 3-like isoform X1 n=1 Tax=Erinaceus europaeus TaxID=9365 RepID=A0ABM3X0S3_ERIEU|nr:neutrophil defensin 3-like isoform X1 [Erinaceus europaeus]
MKFLALLSALLLLTLHGKAQPLGEAPDQLPIAEESVPVTDEDTPLDQTMTEEQGMAISITGDQRLAEDATGYQRSMNCHCRVGKCDLQEQHIGPCGTTKKLCCK